jgi:hypothetical protein
MAGYSLISIQVSLYPKYSETLSTYEDMFCCISPNLVILFLLEQTLVMEVQEIILQGISRDEAALAIAQKVSMCSGLTNVVPFCSISTHWADNK